MKIAIDWNRMYMGSLRFGVKAYRTFNTPISVVMLGGPGAGKGTISKNLAQTTGAVHLSVGDLFRRHIANDTLIGRQVKAAVKSGELVPDAVVLLVAVQEIDENPWKYRRGVILDGAIRTVLQAQAFDLALAPRGLAVSRAILLDPAENVLIERLSKRLTCSNKACGRTFHLTMKAPRVAGHCDECNSPLFQREDDVPTAIAERLSVYRREVDPIRRHYTEKLSVIEPTVDETETQVFAKVINALKGR